MGKNSQDIIDIGFDLLKKYPHIFHGFHRAPFYNDEPKIFQYNTSFKERKNKGTEDAIASGTSFSQTSALQKLFGELIERFSLSDDRERPLIKNKKYEKSKMLSPLLFLSFSDPQIKRLKLKKEEYLYANYSWVESKNVFIGNNFLLPAQLIYVPYKWERMEPMLQFGTSSGAACADTLETAIYRGICELIERDSFMVAYLNKIPCRRINLNCIRDLYINDIINKIERYQLEVYLINITNDLSIFSVCAIIIDRTGLGPSISVGLKAGLDKRNVIVGAIEESLMTRSWTRDKVILGRNLKRYKSRSDIRTIEDRAYYWFSPQMIKNLNFWLNSDLINIKLNSRTTEAQESLYKIAKILKDKGVNFYFAEITSSIFKDYPVHVVKVVSPELQPIYLDERYKYFGKMRLFDSPEKMGYKPKTEEKLNNIPHPFL
ncbi:MAG: hypothetical protein A2894_04500 [Candidatus Levybacteria bacterium RIFCSPLOWO2_01_FULL_40_64]|nr:MAG: hypothetical protein A2894_04500 [Candidatus Levybacteria bacterium RIFCSPLOWO2_01_FULL_40_64]OGH52750.1 MAG: hypothetical protein A3G15_00250 [Candidatus Levybacteria bacterium RIFCSPLOWO2_12_FULL_40_10]